MTDKLRRALRGLLQYFTGSVLTSLIDIFLELTDKETLLVAGILGAVVAFFMNLLEDNGTIPALLYPKGIKPTPTREEE